MKYGTLIFLLSLVVSSAAEFASPESELKAIKSKLPFISTGDLLDNREPRDYGYNDKLKAAWETLLKLNSPNFTVKSLVSLTHHADPDIRALALLGLVMKETPEVLPACLRLINDKSATLPDQFEPGGRLPFEPLATRPQTVSAIARSILSMVECRISDREDPTKDESDAWWAKRKDNPDWLAWYAFLYARASQGTSPVPPESKDSIQRFRKKVDALPAPTRAWILLYLADDVFMSNGKWQNLYASEQEMIDAVKLLGADVIIEFLRSGKRQGLRDPSLDSSGRGRRFIVTYASHFFKKPHAEALLELKLYTSAMDANPENVRRAADEGMKVLAGESDEWEQASIMAALASLGDATDRESAVKWFYDKSNYTNGSSAQSIFIRELEYRNPKHWRDVVHGIVAHPGFGLLKSLDVMYLALLVEKLGSGEKLIPENYRYEDQADTTRDQLRDLFQIKSGTRVSTLKPPEKFLQEPVWKREFDKLGSSLDLSDDGKLLAIGLGNEAEEVRVLSTDQGKEVARFPAAGQNIRVTFATGNHELICAPGSGPDGKTIQIWSDSKGITASHLLQTYAAVHPTRRVDRVATLDTEFLAWLELPGGKTLWKQNCSNRMFSAFQISPDASLIARNDGFSKNIEIIQTTAGQLLHTLTGHAEPLSKFSFSHDSKRLISTADDNRVIMWSLAEGKAIAMYRGEAVRFGPVAFTSDGQSFFASPMHGQLASYSVANGEPQFGIKIGNRIAFAIPSLDGKHLYLMIQHTGSTNLGNSPSKSRIECWNLQ